MFNLFGRILIFLGTFLILMGILFLFGPKIPYFGRLPGDIYIKRENFSFYFPLTSLLILSIVISIIVNIVLKIFRG